MHLARRRELLSNTGTETKRINLGEPWHPASQISNRRASKYRKEKELQQHIGKRRQPEGEGTVSFLGSLLVPERTAPCALLAA